MYPIWDLYQGNIDLFRQDLSRWRVVPTPGYEEQAAVLNKILPVMVDRLTDDDLYAVLERIIQSETL